MPPDVFLDRVFLDRVDDEPLLPFGGGPGGASEPTRQEQRHATTV